MYAITEKERTIGEDIITTLRFIIQVSKDGTTEVTD